MTVCVAIASPYRRNRGIPNARDVLRHSPTFKATIKRGLDDYHQGKVRRWSEVKQELGR